MYSSYLSMFPSAKAISHMDLINLNFSSKLKSSLITLVKSYKEVDSFCYKSLDKIKEDINLHPNKYTEWFKICFNEVLLNHQKT